MASGADNHNDWIGLTPTPSVHLTKPEKSASADHMPPPPYRFASGQDKDISVEAQDNEHLLPTGILEAGPRPRPKRSSAKSCCSCAAYIPDTTLTRTLMLIVLVQAVICFGLETYLFAQSFAESGNLYFFGPFLTVIFESVFQVFLTVYAAQQRNTVQVIGICLNNLSMCIFIGLSYSISLDWAIAYNEDEADASSAATLSAMRGAFFALLIFPVCSTVALGFVGWKLYGEFEWAVYRHISAADIHSRRLYLIYEIYIALLHLDFFFLLGFWVQTLLSVSDVTTYGGLFWTEVAVAVSLPFQLWLSRTSVRREFVPGQAITMILLIGNIALVGAQLYSMFHLPAAYIDQAWYNVTRRLTAYAALALPLLLATTVMAVVCLTNFNRGLKPVLEKGRISANTGRGRAMSGESRRGGNEDLYQLVRSSRTMEID